MPAWPMRQIVVPLGAGTLRGVSDAPTRPIAAFESDSSLLINAGWLEDAGICFAMGDPDSAVTASLTTPGTIFVRAGGGVAGMPEGEFVGGALAAPLAVLAFVRPPTVEDPITASSLRTAESEDF